MLAFRMPAWFQLRAPGRWFSAASLQEPPGSTRRPQSPSQQSSVHSYRFPTMSERPAPFAPYEPTGHVPSFPVPFEVASALGPRRRPLPLRLARQPIRRTRRTAQPRHIRLRVVPAHARHRLTIRLPKAGVPPGIAVARCDAPSPRAATRRRRERPILANRHLVATQRQPAGRHHHHLRTHVAVPEHITRLWTRVGDRRRTAAGPWRATDARAGSRRGHAGGL